MTPERQKWWDSLPAEEKRVRQIYRYTKKEILNFTDHDKKYVIKALRKEIAMRPIVFKYPGYKSYECPRCREGAITYLPHCSMCGQKLRWEE